MRTIEKLVSAYLCLSFVFAIAVLSLLTDGFLLVPSFETIVQSLVAGISWPVLLLLILFYAFFSDVMT